MAQRTVDERGHVYKANMSDVTATYKNCRNVPTGRICRAVDALRERRHRG